MLNDSVDNKITFKSTPEPGQLVEVRKRQWIVADVNTSQLPNTLHKRQSYVKLSSIDEDGLGEELDVIWEIEPGASIIEKSGLPEITGFDNASKLDAFLDAVRWGAATNADRGFLQAPFRSGVSIEDFQLDPLVRAINMARVNLLIADDVGLGKTIEAGLVIQELLLRHRARTVFIICPSSLQLKWQDEMQEKFGLEFKIVNTDYVKKLRRERGIHANPWTSFPRLITSQDWIKSGEGLRLLRETIPASAAYPRKFDMLVIDEAHNVAPSGSAHYAVASQRTKIIREIVPHFQHKLFLTATPHNGYTESFTSLLEMLDDQRFSRNILPDEKQLQKVMIRRLKTDLVDEKGNALYPKRKLHALEVNYTELERKMHKKLNLYAESREKSCLNTKNGMAVKFINGLLKKRLFSSPASFASTLEKHFSTLTNNSEPKQATAIEDRILRKAILKVEEDYANDQELETAQEEAIEEASSRSVPLTIEQKALLNELRSWAQSAQHKSDSKADAICSWIGNNLQDSNAWNNQRVILFTEYRTTQQWLEKILTENGYAGNRLAIINGGMDHEEREEIKAAFQTNPEQSDVRILLATDAASEGIDLQNYCSCLIHLEIPYNPNVMEQRNGRIDRHGQKAKEIRIWHPVDSGAASNKNDSIGGHKDDIIRALTKLESMREDMGSVNPVIAPQMAGLIEGRATELNTELAEAKMAKAKKAVRSERDLQEKIKKLHQQLLSTQEDFHLTPEHIIAAVQTALEVAQKPLLKQSSLPDTPDGSIFTMPEFAGSWAPCNKGLRHPFTDKTRPITFDHKVAKGRDDVVLVHLNHRLVQMCLRLLRSKVWEKDDKLHRVTVRSVPNAQINGIVAIVASRLVVVGGTHNRLHEEITYAGGYLKDNGYNRERSINQINDWMGQSKPAAISKQTEDALKTRFANQTNSIYQTVEARSKERLNNLESTLERLKNKEISDITSVLDELDNAITIELEREIAMATVIHNQMSLFDEEERTEVRKDKAAIEARQKRIESDKKAETEAIEKRYANYIDRTFPVAVIFLVPDNICEAC
ncbi:MAG: DEAD/DEAH box helicase family protein [Endozoicomonadaceae bacterium]|nr:DEAD/DEAH box helicase family protein [Endozoicomonadaceae bacterium]